MPELKNIVPDLELCKAIPKGEFANSALVWTIDGNNGEYHCLPRKYLEELTRDHYDDLPAPTLPEILVELPHVSSYPSAEVYDEKWRVSVFVPGQIMHQYDDSNPAHAALRLWLKLKGVEVK